MIKQFLKKHKSIIIIFIITSILCMLFPYTGDDIAWGFNTLSIDLIKSFSSDLSLNGRYMGNIFSVILAKGVFLRGLLEGLIISLIIYIINKYTKVKYSYIVLLMLIMPLEIFKQSISWASGFANYVISTLCLLIVLLLFQRLWKEKKFNYISIISFFTIILSSLFIENLTVFLLFFLLISNIIYYKKNKSININLIICLLGSIMGSFIMFSQPSYLNIFKGNDVYRNINDDDGLINRIMGNYGLVIKTCIIETTAPLFAFILYIIHKNNKPKKDNKYINIYFKYSFMYLIYAIILTITNLENKLSYLIYVNIVLSLIFIIGFILLIYKYYKSNNNIMNIMLTIIGLLAPLFVVTPIGPRNMFMIYILEIILALFIYNTSKIKINNKTNKYTLYAIMVLLVFYFIIYGSVCYYFNKRINYIENFDKKQKELVLYRLPLGEYVYSPDYSGNNDYYVRIKYNISENTVITYVDYSDFIKQ